MKIKQIEFTLESDVGDNESVFIAHLGLLRVVYLTKDNVFEVAELAGSSELIYSSIDDQMIGFIRRGFKKPIYVGNYVSINEAGYCEYWRGYNSTTEDELKKEFEKLEDYEN